MGWKRPIARIGVRRPGPVPVPELGAHSPERTRHRIPTVLTVRTMLVALVVVFGVASSGLAASRASDRASSTAITATISNAAPKLATTTTTSTTAPPAPTTSTSPTTSLPSVAHSDVTAPLQTTTTLPVPTSSGNIQASGTQLYLNGAVYHFVGVDAYEAATDWGTNAGCGADLSDAQMNQLFSSLPPNSLVRFWAFQGTMATNINTHQLDWGPLDRVFAAAAANHQRLIVVLTDQGGTCDGGHWQDPSWYEGGFKSVFNDPTTTDGRGLTPLSYWQYLQEIVSRYASSPALGMWEPISEAEASTCAPQFQPTNCSGNQTCPNEAVAASALRYFFDTVGAEIHTLDPNHLVESGLLGGGQCGTQGSDYQYVSASPGINVLSYHDYYGASVLGGDQWNGLAVRLVQSRTIGKPIIAGEMGIPAGAAPGCMSDAARNATLIAKDQAQLQAGSSGMLVWDWVPSATGSCSTDVAPTDPILQAGGVVG